MKVFSLRASVFCLGLESCPPLPLKKYLDLLDHRGNIARDQKVSTQGAVKENQEKTFSVLHRKKIKITRICLLI